MIVSELDRLSAKIEGDMPAPVREDDYERWSLINAEMQRLAAEMACVDEGVASRRVSSERLAP